MARIDDAIKNLTVEELDLLNSDPEMLAEFKKKYGDEKTSMIGKAWDALKLPEELSREGLGMIADAVPGAEPTGNVVRDVALNTPKILAETLADTAPEFISRDAIVTAGALKGAKLAAPVAKAAGRQLAKGAEAISGLEYKDPGILRKAFSNRKIISGPSSEKVRGMYEGLIDKSQVRQTFARSTDPKDLVKEAMQAIDEGTLTPSEALIARRTLDKIKKTLPDYSFREMRDAFDGIAKTITKDADVAFSAAKKTDALRNIFPQNKLGGTSIAKSFLGSLAGIAPMAAMSPLVQGSVATGLGIGSRAVAPLLEHSLITGAGVGVASRGLQELLDLAERFRR